MEKKEAYKFTADDAENYDYYLGPVLFQPYGEYLAAQIDNTSIKNVLELACGTGRVTQFIRKALPEGTNLWATDLSADMLDIARRRLGAAEINYKTEDIQNLSFDDNSFDLVICQFGMMFLPDKQQGFNEIFRVLKPGGKLMCFTWDDTSNNPVFKMLVNELMFPYFAGEDTSRFLTPFSLHNPRQLTAWMENAGFKDISVEKIVLGSGQASIDHLETGIYRKHPLGKAIKEKDPSAFEPVAQKFREGLVKQFGDGDISFPMSALLTIGIK